SPIRCGRNMLKITDYVKSFERHYTSVFRVGLRPGECVADRLRILRGEQHPHDLATVLIMIEDFLADEPTLAIAVGGQPHPLGRAQCLSNQFKLGSFVAALGRASAVEALGPQKDWGPTLPGRHH